MNNSAIANNFSLLAKLMDIHGENSFKSKSYANAAFTIDKLPAELSQLPEEKIESIKGIGEAICKKILQQLHTGELPLLNEYIQKTPIGVLEMLKIKGLGAKKISTIWKELEIETIGELLYACNENRLMLYKGFGEKTQQNIKEAIEFYLQNQGSYLYAEISGYADALTQQLQAALPQNTFLLTGAVRRHLEIVEQIEWITTAAVTELQDFFTNQQFETLSINSSTVTFKSPHNVEVQFHLANTSNQFTKLFITSCSEAFLQAWQQQFPLKESYNSEEIIFTEAGIAFIPPYLRESPAIISKAKDNNLPEVIQPKDITAIIHSHSTWSDGSFTIAAMAKAAIEKGFQYLVISDHSKTATYAGGLYEEKVSAQHQEINELNAKLAPFKIFKSIESDILSDGSLDYASDVLTTFDLVIASVHSNLKMSEDRAMKRLLIAIENPYTSILGHMTGRLLLSRSGFPVNHKTIIDACAANNVVIELNANPRRLDMDWRYIDYALEKGVLISIDPDAHSINGFNDIYYGVLVAQKAGLTKQQNLSSFSLQQFETFIAGQKAKRPM
ncbi:DNA polymerase/3'-5' exonuclease PolX [Ilyomonas limi]|uniref:DNA polymerase/3'-5' exonuclease PolX n=1 Tax=Ilyomonas limi TaxID=2575867 RepID=A0A4U3L6K1_9BACT|nr:DNA polymerase/3'-5' exonuclease PolX [Ilyomonas limi]TKK70881.1 DNA polymerase/3'-5' exonuclease PolX [Ilyomonas limi]